MSLASWRAAVKAVLDGASALSGVPVYDYIRHVKDEAGIKALLVASERMHFWCVTAAQTDTLVVQRFPGNCDQGTYGLEVHGYYALKDADASEKAFLDSVAEPVFDALRAARHLTGDVGSGPPQWVEANHVMYVDVLAHHVRFNFPVRAQLS
jgi:hypothetical protein